MVSQSAPVRIPTADAVEFVRFCYARRSVGWPELYDEMCAVAGRGLFRGWGADDLAGHGIAFGLAEMPAVAAFVSRIVAEERAAAAARAQAARGARLAKVAGSV
jgi:hypothetical protein